MFLTHTKYIETRPTIDESYSPVECCGINRACTICKKFPSSIRYTNTAHLVLGSDGSKTVVTLCTTCEEKELASISISKKILWLRQKQFRPIQGRCLGRRCYVCGGLRENQSSWGFSYFMMPVCRLCYRANLIANLIDIVARLRVSLGTDVVNYICATYMALQKYHVEWSIKLNIPSSNNV